MLNRLALQISIVYFALYFYPIFFELLCICMQNPMRLGYKQIEETINKYR